MRMQAFQICLISILISLVSCQKKADLQKKCEILDSSPVAAKAFGSLKNLPLEDKGYLTGPSGLDFRLVDGYQEVKKLVEEATGEQIMDGFYGMDKEGQFIMNIHLTGGLEVVLYEKSVPKQNLPVRAIGSGEKWHLLEKHRR